MKEVIQVSGKGNNSGLKIFEDDALLEIQVPLVLVSRSWRFLITGLILIIGSIVFPILFYALVGNFLLRSVFFLITLGLLMLGVGLFAISVWELNSAIILKINPSELSVYHPAFFKSRSILRKFPIHDIKALFVNKVRVVGNEKYALMLDKKNPPDDRLIKGFYKPYQALWISEEINLLIQGKKPAITSS